MIVVLTGGTGGAKFVDGLRRIVPSEELTIIVNTGDDHEWWGLRVAPDIDSITYVLAGILSRERGWGVRGETFHCLQAMKELGEPAWFSVGDRDLATHLLRTKLLSHGRTLTQATRVIAERLNVGARILPMSDMRVETRIDTPTGNLSFEEYFVKRRYRDVVNAVSFAGAPKSEPAPGVLEAIACAQAVLLAPSNPVTSIGPILSVPGIRQALSSTSAPVVAVSPIIGGAAVSGPAAELMKAQGLDVSVAGVAEAYKDFLDILVAHDSDQSAAQSLRDNGLRVHCANILMQRDEDRARIAQTALAFASPELATAYIAEVK